MAEVKQGDVGGHTDAKGEVGDRCRVWGGGEFEKKGGRGEQESKESSLEISG
jgi:hypothetical protein